MALVYDPTQQIYADSEKYQAPDTPQVNSSIGQPKSPDEYIDPEKATVAGQLDTNLQVGSPLIESAQADAMKTMNSRGGLNSTMAASAGTKAAIDSVMPIAQQDAQTYAAFGAENQKTENQALINNQAADLEQQQTQSSAEMTGALKEQEFGNAEKHTAFTYELDKQLVEMGISAAERKSAQDAIDNQTVTLMNNIGSWVNNPDLELTESTPEWLTAYMYEGWETTASLYGLDIEVV